MAKSARLSSSDWAKSTTVPGCVCKRIPGASSPSRSSSLGATMQATYSVIETVRRASLCEASKLSPSSVPRMVRSDRASGAHNSVARRVGRMPAPLRTNRGSP
ncbi:hypothetical protein D9M68_780980 [compost metagenome]